ncbi:MAG: hypothetical protein GY870_02515 [archaeon]|nr:hypothetical protein [archaeon]
MDESEKESIDLLFNPKSVAVIGASVKEMKGGNRILRNLLNNNYPYPKKIYPINPKSAGQEAYGLKFYASIFDIEDPIDVAIIFVANSLIPKILKECIKKGIKGAIIQAAGFEEVGDKGLILRDEIIEITENFKKIRIVGPNCTGLTNVINDNSGFFSAFVTVDTIKRKGNIAVISQSGMLNAGYFIHIGSHYPNFGLKYSASVGNKMDLSEIEFLDYFLDDPDVNVIALYLESFKNPRKFLDLCKKAKLMDNKVVILLKGGQTIQGQRATLSHTGSLAENTKLSKVLIKQSGVIEVKSFNELFKTAITFSHMFEAGINFPKKGNVSIITVSGGAGTVSTDLINHYGLKIPKLKQETYKILEGIYPSWMPPSNIALLDLWPAIESSNLDLKGIHNISIDAVLSDPNIEGLFLTIFAVSGYPLLKVSKLAKYQEKYKKPIFIWLFGEKEIIQRFSNRAEKKKLMVFTNLEEMIKNYRTIINY